MILADSGQTRTHKVNTVITPHVHARRALIMNANLHEHDVVMCWRKVNRAQVS